jgi:hypothetical protein
MRDKPLARIKAAFAFVLDFKNRSLALDGKSTHDDTTNFYRRRRRLAVDVENSWPACRTPKQWPFRSHS